MFACALLTLHVGCGDDDGGTAKADAAANEPDAGRTDASTTPPRVSYAKDVKPIFALH